MARSSSSWGIDVGREAVKAVKLVQRGGKVEVEAFEVLPYDQVLTAPDVDVDASIQVKLDELAQKHELKKSRVVASVPGNMAFARFANLPPVDPKTIPKIVRFEAEQQIPFPIDEVEWDYQVFQDPDTPDVKVGIFAITKERVMEFLSNFRAVDLKIDALTLSPVAVFNAFAYDAGGGDEADGGGTVYLDIGTLSTDVVIIENGDIWLRTVPIGGNQFTEALVRQFKISFAKAEKLKREAATSKYAKQIFQAMRSVFADLVQEVQRSIGYYQSLNRDSELGQVVGLGSTFKLPGLQKFLKQQLQMDVKKPTAWARATVDPKRESELVGKVDTLTTAYGLALQGLGLEKVSANILPAHVLQQRMWQAKQPWIAAAAACVALGSGLYGARYFVDRAELTAATANIAQIVRPVVADATRYQQEAEEAITQDPRQGIENLRQVVPLRDVYPWLLADLDAAIASVGMQEEVASGVEARMASVPRQQRRQLVIDSIEDTYVPAPEGDSAAAAAPTPAADPFGGYGGGGVPGAFGDPYGGGFGAGVGGGGGGGGSAGGGTPTDLAAVVSQGATKAFFSGELGPRLSVVIRGTTPFENPSNLLNETILRWLRDNADRPERPYVIQVDDGAIVFLAQQGSDPNRRRGPSAGNGGFGGAGGFGGGAGFGGFDAGGFGGPGAGGNSTATASLRAGDIASLMPTRPLADEDTSTDYRFELTFDVQLRDPSAPAAAAGGDAGEPGDASADLSADASPAGGPAADPTDEVNS